jgi:hypothetical protein
VIDFFWRVYVRAISMPESRLTQIMREQADRYDAPVKQPALWQVMILPVVILTTVILIVVL